MHNSVTRYNSNDDTRHLLEHGQERQSADTGCPQDGQNSNHGVRERPSQNPPPAYTTISTSSSSAAAAHSNHNTQLTHDLTATSAFSQNNAIPRSAQSDQASSATACQGVEASTYTTHSTTKAKGDNEYPHPPVANGFRPSATNRAGWSFPTYPPPHSTYPQSHPSYPQPPPSYPQPCPQYSSEGSSSVAHWDTRPGATGQPWPVPSSLVGRQDGFQESSDAAAAGFGLDPLRRPGSQPLDVVHWLPSDPHARHQALRNYTASVDVTRGQGQIQTLEMSPSESEEPNPPSSCIISVAIAVAVICVFSAGFIPALLALYMATRALTKKGQKRNKESKQSLIAAFGYIIGALFMAAPVYIYLIITFLNSQ